MIAPRRDVEHGTFFRVNPDATRRGADEPGGSTDTTPADDGGETAGSFGSPSLAFLRDLAHVSDRAPDTFDAQRAASEAAAGAAPDVPARFALRRRLGFEAA